MTTRKDFLVQITGGGLGLLLAGCGGGGDDGGTPQAAATCGAAFSFTGHEGHTLTIPRADLDSTTDKTYSTRGEAPHIHQVTLTAAQLADLKAGRSITVTSTEAVGMVSGVHTHDITGPCA